jgi:arylsulfatase A-like enzyme
LTRSGRRLAVAAALLVAACSVGDAPHTVIARVADGTLTASATPDTHREKIRKITLGTRTRDALRVAADSRFEIEVPTNTRRMALSLGVPGRPPCPIPIRFVVSAVAGNSAQVLLDSTPEPSVPAWHDHELDLRTISPPPARLRFETWARFADDDQARACASNARPWWGSLLAIGPGPAVDRNSPRLSADASLPSVVMISLDTLGAAQLSSFGGPDAVSPHLDQLLAESFSFRRAIANYGHTRPSTASLLSSVYPFRHGAYPDDLIARFDSLVPVLANAGYRTVAFTEGAYLAAAFGLAAGFDEYDDGLGGTETASRSDALATFDRAARWLEAHGANQRFFLFLQTYEVHIPYLPRDAEALAVAKRLTPGVDRFFTRDLQLRAMLDHNRGKHLLDEDELAHLHALHASEVHYLDRVLGLLLDRLTQFGLDRDTLLVVTSDHGDQFGEHGKLSHGESLHNRVHHVPLGFRWPARVTPGTSDSPVQLVDVMPTLFDLVGIPGIPDLDGRSLAPVVLGEAPVDPRPAISELRSAPGECERLGVPSPCRLGRYSVQDHRFKLEVSERPQAQALYDLDADPLEQRDVADQHPDVLAELQAALAGYRSQMGSTTPEPRPDPAILDDTLRRQLESLGYLPPDAGAPPPESPDSKN